MKLKTIILSFINIRNLFRYILLKVYLSHQHVREPVFLKTWNLHVFSVQMILPSFLSLSILFIFIVHDLDKGNPGHKSRQQTWRSIQHIFYTLSSKNSPHCPYTFLGPPQTSPGLSSRPSHKAPSYHHVYLFTCQKCLKLWSRTSTNKLFRHNLELRHI